jgi:lipopolysaccharide/colanic/teichoic acid biosynthesis glycosyltransferase
VLKRTLDLALATAALIVLAPLLLLIVVGITLDSPGPVLYSQVRVGRRGRLFRLHKFRSMVADADRRGPSLTQRSDTRITRLGRVLRPLRLDELPQLFNVVKGDMSLVGPRPEVPSLVARYTGGEREVLSVRPGLAGPTHLAWLDEAERYPEGVDAVEYYVAQMLPDKLRRDLEYVRTRSFLTDVWWLLRVPPALVRHALRDRRSGARAGADRPQRGSGS